jgi:hypothetical protein
VLTVSVVIPVYRAALTLRELHGQLSITMPQIAQTSASAAKKRRTTRRSSPQSTKSANRL